MNELDSMTSFPGHVHFAPFVVLPSVYSLSSADIRSVST